MQSAKRQGEYKRVWYRYGNDNEFSEFTLGQLSSGRGTGVATGMYAYQRETSAKGLQPVSAPSNPIVINVAKDQAGHGTNQAWFFNQISRSMMAHAEAYAKAKDDGKESGVWSTMGKVEPFGSFDHLLFFRPLNARFTIWDIASELSRASNRTFTKEEVWGAVRDWSIYRQVHPINILLARLGYDGLMYGEDMLHETENADYGAVRFPPMTKDGEVIGVTFRGKYGFLAEQVEGSAAA